MTSHQSLFVRSIVCIVFVFAILSPTINLLVRELIFLKILIHIMVGSILLVLFSPYTLTIRGYNIILLCLVLAAVTLSPFTILKNVCFFYFIFIYSNKYKKVFQRVAVICFLANFVFIICQLLGVSEFFYLFQDYSNEAEPTLGEFKLGSVVDSNFSYLPQIRPSGIMPSPTYISNFCIFFWYYVLIDKDYKNKILFFLFGFTLMLLGSTLAVLLLLVSLFFINYKSGVKTFLLGGICGSLFYLYYFPLAFIYNFNVEEFIESFLVRIISNGINEESMLIANPILFGVIILVLAIIPFFLRSSNALIVLFKAAIVIVLPIMIHDAFSSIQYWITVSFFATDVLKNENFNLANFHGNKLAQSDLSSVIK